MAARPQPQRRTNFSLIAGIILILIAGVVFYSAYTSVSKQEAVMVAAERLDPYLALVEDQIRVELVASGSITDNDLTEAEYRELYADQGIPLVPLVAILDGQRIDERAIAQTAQASFSVVSPDERVVGVTATLPAAVLGTLQGGDVVDARSTEGEPLLTVFAKVICISAKSEGCRGVLPTGQDITGGDDGSSPIGASQQVKVILAVPEQDAIAIAGKAVALSLNPFCRVDQSGMFVSVRIDAPCRAPADRLASQGETVDAKENGETG